MSRIIISPRSAARLRMKAYLYEHTREPRGSEVEWQKRLTEFDPELILRWSYLCNQYIVFYDHHGELTTIRAFGPREFGQAFLNIKHNATLNARRLRRMKQRQEEEVEKGIDKEIEECGAEFGEELHHATRERLISDSTIEPRHRRKR